MSSDPPAAAPATDSTLNEESSVPDGASSSNVEIMTPKKAKIWAWPWIIMLVALYLFALPWMNIDILNRYFMKPNWSAALPGLDSTPLRKFSMGSHMAAGAVCILLGPLQLIPKIRKSYPRIHRWSGRIYCICAVLSCVSGLMFISLKRELVGGYNMTVAFSVAGSCIGFFGLKTWQSARTAKADGKMDFTPHRNWGIRSYSQILAPMLYRYWYTCLLVFDLYNIPKPLALGGFCRMNDTCPDYSRILDKIHCWTYWLTSLAVAESIIYYLPRHEPTDSEQDNITSDEAINVAGDNSEMDASAPLLAAERERNTSRNVSCSSEIDLATETTSINAWMGSPLTVNVIGCIMAFITVVITWKIFTFPHGPNE